MTATHVLGDQALKGQAGITCFGPATSGVDTWHVTSITRVEPGDIALLSLSLASEIRPSWCVRTFPITTRRPNIGEKTYVVGFRSEDPVVRRVGHRHEMEGELLVASGKVAAIHFPIRDHILLPFPAIEIECGSLGGMSGGALLDSTGHLLGVISRGWQTEDGSGPTYAAWVIHGFTAVDLDIPWPPGLYKEGVGLLEIEEPLLMVAGRERLRMSGTKLSYDWPEDDVTSPI